MSFDINSSTGQAISNALFTLNNGGFDTSFTGDVHQNPLLPPSSENMDFTPGADLTQPNPEGNLEVGNLSANATNAQTFSSKTTSLTRKRSVSELSNSYESKKLSVDPNNSSDPPESSRELIYNVPTGNRFSELGKVNTETEDTRFAYLNTLPNENLSQTVKIPPIFVSNITNISNFTKELKHKVSSNFISDVKYDKVKISAKTPTDFRNIVKYLIHTERSFHSYKDPSNKKFSVVFKNLHQSITESEIALDLQHRHPSILKVTRLQKDGNPIPVVAAEFNGSEPIEIILSIDQICNHRVSVERRKKPKGPLQCQRCLDFGHTKNNCNHVINCAFCAGNHYSVKCPKKNETPTCALCKGDHRADIRNQNCAYFKELSERKIKNPTSDIRNKNQSNNSQSSQVNLNQQFPYLPHANRIPGFNHISGLRDQSGTAQNSHNASPSNSQSQVPHASNPIINSIINAITSCIINFINSLIPSIISTIQNSVTEYLTNNNGR